MDANILSTVSTWSFDWLVIIWCLGSRLQRLTDVAKLWDSRLLIIFDDSNFLEYITMKYVLPSMVTRSENKYICKIPKNKIEYKTLKILNELEIPLTFYTEYSQ